MRREDRFGEGFDVVLAAAQAGAGWAFERLWRTFAAPVTGYLCVQGASEPEDLASEVFLGAFRTLATFSGDEAAFRSWLFTIATDASLTPVVESTVGRHPSRSREPTTGWTPPRQARRTR